MVSDPRAMQAREAHRLRRESDRIAAQHRAVRQRLIRALRADHWTYPQIAEAIGCSMQLIAAIFAGRVGPGSARGRHADQRERDDRTDGRSNGRSA